MRLSKLSSPIAFVNPAVATLNLLESPVPLRGSSDEELLFLILRSPALIQ